FIHLFVFPMSRHPRSTTLFPYTTLFRSVIHSPTFVSAAAAPAAPNRTSSRSVRIPIGRSPSTTTTEPTPAASIRAQASATVSERSEEHTSELQSRENLVCRLLLEKKKKQ